MSRDLGPFAVQPRYTRVGLVAGLGASMPEFRVYVLDETGERCAAAVSIHEDSDEKAILAATLLLDDHDLDLWEGTRRVTTLRTGKPTSGP
jgi:hypothetical protein